PALASPFEPREPPPPWPFQQSSFFDGWFLRLVDHENKFSFCLILGSLREHGKPCTRASGGYSSHFVGISYLDSKGKTHTYNFFPDPRAVSIDANGAPPVRRPSRSTPPNFRWSAAGVGELLVQPESGTLEFSVPEASVKAKFHGRIPWSRSRPNKDGPEGWLAGTGLLPLHYFVHSFGSAAEYEFEAKHDKAEKCSGSGRLHMECNYGDMFPHAWVWGQGCSRPPTMATHLGDGSIGSGDIPADFQQLSFVLTGGQFRIGPLTSQAWVIALRWGDEEWNFRTTDLDEVTTLQLSRKARAIRLRALSRCKTRLLEVRDVLVAPEHSFGKPIAVPTHKGWSTSPGCVESYNAAASFRCYHKEHGQWQLILEKQVPLAAMEFGGAYQST
ncbi:hypothetical protein JKP88DRAFT_304593, partial [Tribonema minus]